MKQVAIKVAGTEGDPIDIQLQPGQTAGEVLHQLGFKDGLLSPVNPTKIFAPEEELYDQLKHGETLYALLPTIE